MPFTPKNWQAAPSTATPISDTALEDMETRLSAYTDTRFAKLPVNVKEYGAVGDGSTNDAAAITSAIAATPVGGTLFLPAGNYRCASQIVVDKRINVRGEGMASALTFDLDTSTDGLVFATGSIAYMVHWRDFAVLAASNKTRYGLVLRDAVQSTFKNIHVKAGGSWEVSVEGSMISDFELICPGNNATFPYSAATATNGIRVVGSATYPVNASRFNCIVEARTGDGLKMDGSVGTGGDFNNYITGTYEGLDGKGIHIKSCFGFTVRDVHLEDPDHVTNALYIELSANGEVGPGAFVDGPVQLVGSDRITLDGLKCETLSIDSSSDHNRLGQVYFNLSGSGTLTDSGPGTMWSGLVADTTSAVVSPWRAPTLLNTWINFGSGFSDAGYYKDSSGLVHLRGVIRNGTVPADVFVLPVGYRPAATLIFPIVSNDLLGQVRINSSGNVHLYAGSNTWVALDGIRPFRAV
jgi:hypothetical protein